MSAPTYDVDYFIAKFEAIPEEKWVEGHYTIQGRFGECHCALGHCDGHSPLEGEALSLAQLFQPGAVQGWDSKVSQISDGVHPDFQQSTPKQRILAALRSLKGGAQ